MRCHSTGKMAVAQHKHRKAPRNPGRIGIAGDVFPLARWQSHTALRCELGVDDWGPVWILD